MLELDPAGRRIVGGSHVEAHSGASESVRDVVIGMSDGLTVPFALAAGISGAVAGTALVVTAGFAEIAAGSIAMGLGGYLAARSESEHYASERRREELEIVEKTEFEEREVLDVLARFGLKEVEAGHVMEGLKQRPDDWVEFMMRFELGLEKPDPRRALRSALTIGGAYAVGGIIPLVPYILLRSAQEALAFSVVMTLVALFAFGWAKGHFTGVRALRSAIQTTLIGGAAAAVAFGIARLIAPGA